MNDRLADLVKRWRRDAEQYRAQIEEARRAGTPHDQMLSMMTALRQCASELERELKRTVNLDEINQQ